MLKVPVIALLIATLYLFCSNRLTAAEKSIYEFFPTTHIYPHYIANPIRSHFSFQPLFISHSDIPQTGDNRFDLNLGASFGLLRLYPENNPQKRWQLTLEAGFRGQFDNQYSQDNIGWDGHYALFVDYRHHDHLAHRIGIHHTSSHVGDEYMERTGRNRINYTREEIRLASAWQFTPQWLTYIEVAEAYILRNKNIQQSGRAEWGIQYDHTSFFTSRIGGYVALDISAYEENHWNGNASLQFGISWPSRERRWRLGFEYYDGRSQMGEFFQHNDTYLSLGLWQDI